MTVKTEFVFDRAIVVVTYQSCQFFALTGLHTCGCNRISCFTLEMRFEASDYTLFYDDRF